MDVPPLGEGVGVVGLRLSLLCPSVMLLPSLILKNLIQKVEPLHISVLSLQRIV